MNHTTTTSITIIIAAALAASMVVAGTSMSSLQQHKAYAASQTKNEEQSTVQSLHGNFAKRSASQHSDQENQCLRASNGKCSNAALGEQTFGNDNSVTGFTDQSTTNNPTSTPSTTPGPAAGKPETLVVNQRSGPNVDVSPGDTVTTTVKCNPGEIATGGGVATLFVPPNGSTPPYLVDSLANSRSSPDGWQVSVHNPGTSPVTIQAVAECAGLAS